MKCPKCGSTMTGGSPHGPWPVQWECRCGHIVVPSSISLSTELAADAIEFSDDVPESIPEPYVHAPVYVPRPTNRDIDFLHRGTALGCNTVNDFSGGTGR